MTEGKKYDLEDRLVSFAITVMEVCENLHNTRAGNHISGQLIRCGSAPALNYAEAQSAESRADFIHKMKISLKELRETRTCLKIIQKKPLSDNNNMILSCLNETEQLISIFVKSISTAQTNNFKK
ncbi:MAG: four helix bundle protein [Runella slithyformis]|nr:MAG: four helix bundle protein [Runella slithyformis]TAF44334.1 MAG: four helix bundle protein [Runella slithyformis]TAF80729.1 MAG: four helix bundle protein [Runella slithyformis]